MDTERLRVLLAQVHSGQTTIESALEALRRLPFEELSYARVDHHRELRMGMPEVILAEGKTTEQIIGIARHMLDREQRVLITRLGAEPAHEVCAAVPVLRYVPLAKVATHGHDSVPKKACSPIAVVSAGTSDIPVAEEAIETLQMFGLSVKRVYDVGVAGIHRVMQGIEPMAAAPAIIVVAGMEGALPSVVGGMVGTPVIAVPTSVGYGAALAGFAALAGMLTACASGVTVVNIDNGFGAAMAVARIVLSLERNARPG